MNKKYEKLFETVTLPNGMELKNRFVLAPMTHNSSNEDGTISEGEIKFSELRSKDVGLSINAASNVNDIGKAFPGQPSVAHDSDIEGLKQLANAMKKNGAKALVQIHHAGAKSLPHLTPNGDVVAPSPISMETREQEEYHAREITPQEIEQTIKDFGQATRRVIEAGFDGVEIHGANHYIIHQFVSPYYNKRKDEWADPMKFPVAIIDEVLKVKEQYTTNDFIVGYRLSPEEAESPGITMEITEQLINTIVEKNLDYIHISLSRIHSETREGKYEGQERLKLITQWVDGRMPVISVGSIFTAADALDALETSGINLVALGRELLLDYNFISKIREGKEDEIISYFDPYKDDKYLLTQSLWEKLNSGFYSLPRKDD